MTPGWLGLVIGGLATAFLAYRLGRLGADRTARELEQVRYELARRLNELFSLQELSYLLSESLKVERIVTQVARYVTRFLDADGALVVLAGEDADRIRVSAAEGTLAPLADRILGRAEAGPLGQVIGREQLEVVEAAPGAPLLRVAEIPVQRVAVAPLRSHGVTVGALAAVNRSGDPFTAEALRLLSMVATHASVVLANARFFDLMRSGKEQWETTFDALADGIAVVDEAGRVRRANKSLADLVGRPLPSIIDMEFDGGLLGGARAPELAALLQLAGRGQETSAITLQGLRNRVLRIQAAPMRSAPATGWVAVLVEDVTEQKTLEAQLIQNERMVAVGQLVSGVAHELNNPLTSIAGLSEFLLEQGSGNERDREHLKVIQEQAERAGRIVRNLLTFARKGAGEYEEIDLNDVAQRTALLMQYELRLRDVQLESRLSPGLPTVMGDRFELQQVVLNLLTNAVHSVAQNPPTRERRVVLSTGIPDGDEGRVVLRVADTGPGIDKEHLPNLFTPFFTTKEPGEGTGLGLSISFGIVERHGGRLSAEPSDQGAQFVMELPVADRSTSKEVKPRRSSGRISAPAGAGAEAPKEPRSILLVDDDPAVQRTIRALFSRDGQVVSAPPTAGDAMRLLETSRYDLIIADARAAVTSGEMFADALLRMWPEHSRRTIFLTADVRPQTHEWLRSTGCRYFQKPFKVSELRSTIKRMMED